MEFVYDVVRATSKARRKGENKLIDIQNVYYFKVFFHHPHSFRYSSGRALLFVVAFMPCTIF